MSSSRTAASALPDVNAETYPYDFVQQLLDQTADFSFFAVPNPAHAGAATLTPGDPEDYFGLNGGYGIDLASALHRFDSVLQPPGSGGLEVHQAVGEAEGILRCRWLFGAADFPWHPGHLPPPAIYDPWRPQRFAFCDGVFDLGNGHGFRGYGVGRTFPTAVDGQPRILAGAVGNVTGGSGRFAGLEGTFVLAGTLTPALGFLGNVTCRIVDPEGRLRSRSDLPPLGTVADPDPGSTFLVLRGEKKDRTVRTTYGPPPDARRVSLVTPSQMRAMRYGFSAQGERGPRTRAGVHQIAGTMEATVFFDLLAPPGTAELPVPFTTSEVYEFHGPGGRALGTVRAAVEEGISFGLTFPAAPGQPGVRFSGFGPIQGGTGAFEGAQGLLTVNSLIGIAPHALSLLHVLHVVDPGGRLRSGRSADRSQVAVPRALPPADTFHSLARNKEGHTGYYRRWREGFRKCAAVLSDAVAGEYNGRLKTGDFPGLAIDAKKLRRTFEAKEIKPFDPETFDRYTGPAWGDFRTYGLGDGREQGAAVLYSYWNHDNLDLPDGRTAKKIAGSFSGYVRPDALPDLAGGTVDVILNSYRPDVGITSWVEIFQGGRHQRTSFAYKLPAPHEVLWFVKDISKDGQRLIDSDVFMASHEWKGKHEGKVAYFMVGIFFEIDFERCHIALHGDTFWRALYLEDPAEKGPQK